MFIPLCGLLWGRKQTYSFNHSFIRTFLELLTCATHWTWGWGYDGEFHTKPILAEILACPPRFTLPAWTPSDCIFQLCFRNSQDLKPGFTGFMGDKSFLLQPVEKVSFLFTEPAHLLKLQTPIAVWGPEKGVGARREVFSSSGFGLKPEQTLPSHPFPSWNEWVLLGWSYCIWLVSVTPSSPKLCTEATGSWALQESRSHRVPKCPSGSGGACEDARLPSRGCSCHPGLMEHWWYPSSQEVSPSSCHFWP